DRVSIVGDTSGDREALARIVRIEERTSVLRRSADDDDTTVEGRTERVIVANVDQLVIVCSLDDPPPRTGFIDRCLVAAYDADIEPLLCLPRPTWPARRTCSRTTPSSTCRTCSPGPTGRCPRSRTRCATRSRCWWATPGWASRRWSTGSSRRPTGRSVW